MAVSDFLHPPAHKTLRDWVFDCLRSSIISGELAPGQRIVEADLAKQLDVSKSPVREAILQLKQDGLVVDASKGRGVIVAPLRAVDVEEIFAVRGALEALAVRLAAKRTSSEDVHGLRALLDKMSRAQASGDWRQMNALDVDFHASLCAASGNGRLMNLFESIRPDLQRIFFFAATTDGSEDGNRRDGDHTFADYSAILTSIEASDPDQAESRLRTHVEKREADVISALGRTWPADESD